MAARYVPVGDRSGIDVSEMIATLRDVGYDGWFSVHQPLQEGETVEHAIRDAYAAVAPLIA